MPSRSSLLAIAALAVALVFPGVSQAADVRPGEVIVKFDASTTPAEQTDVKQETGTSTEQALPGDSRQLAIDDGQSVRQTVAELNAQPGVAYAVPNYVAHASRARIAGFDPNDPGRSSRGGWAQLQWNFTGPASVNAPEAWALAAAEGAPGGRGAVVAVLDTGVAYENRGRFRRAPDLAKGHLKTGYDFVSNDRHPDDENGHGTHVAGTIAQSTNNRVGVTGLAYNARLMPVRVLDALGEGDAAAISRGIRYAARHGAKVINLSLEFDASVSASEVPDLLSAIRFAHRKRVVVVGAAGNQSTAVSYPARANYVISVGATTEHACAAEYSSGGTGLDISAPGGGFDAIYSDNPRDAQNCRPDSNGRDIYQQTYTHTNSFTKFGLPSGYEGTSMSSPHVAAIAALLIATKRLGAHPSPDAIEQRLKQTSRDLGPDGPDGRYGAGLVNAAAALAP